MFSSDYDDLIWLKDEVEKLLSNHKFIINAGTVSYTHLTLPTMATV